jgi:hypothetical protein
MTRNWSISDQSKGARTIKEITEKATLVRPTKTDSTVPMFPFIPMERVVIDSLYLFLRISDVLINLLIRD